MKTSFKDKVIYSATKSAYEKLIKACYLVYNRELLKNGTLPQDILSLYDFSNNVHEVLKVEDLVIEEK